MDQNTFFWVLARVAGLSCFAALSISLLTGVALRSALFEGLASNRAVRSTHEFTALLWAPLGLVHVLSLTLDEAARIGLLDLVIPFRVPYGTLAMGLGTIALDLYLLVAVTGWLRRSMDTRWWQWIHRLAYPAYLVSFLHAVLGGTDFSLPVVTALAWTTAAALAVLSVARMVWGRVS